MSIFKKLLIDSTASSWWRPIAPKFSFNCRNTISTYRRRNVSH